jgi:hypothetical protein
MTAAGKANAADFRFHGQDGEYIVSERNGDMLGFVAKTADGTWTASTDAAGRTVIATGLTRRADAAAALRRPQPLLKVLA